MTKRSVVGLCIFVLACLLVAHQLRHYRLSAMLAEMRAIPGSVVIGVLALMVLQFLAVVQYDVLALHWLRKKMAYKKIALAGFLANSLSRTIGFSFLVGGGLRYRFYRMWGLSPEQIGKLVSFHFGSLVLG